MADLAVVAIPIVTLLIGWALSQIGDARKDRRQAARDRALSEAQSAERVVERRTAFQRETLLALQEAMAGLVRATGRIHYEDTLQARVAGEPWGTAMVTEELSERHMEVTVETSKLLVRIEDAQLRELVANFVTFSSGVGRARSKEESRKLLAQTIEAHALATECLGALLRSVY